MSRGSSPTGLCWSSSHLVQCGPDEPSWTWTQIWVQAHMPDCSLNWTMGSSAIQGWRSCQCCSSPTRRWPSRIQGPFGLKSAMEHWQFGMDARQSAEQSAKMEYLFITITLRSMQTQSSNIDWVWFMGQIELFNHLLRIIIISLQIVWLGYLIYC